MALGKASRKFDLLFNPMKISEALGYNFHEIEHGAELLASVGPPILPIDPSSLSSDPVPLFDLPGVKSRLVLWSRGHFKTSAVALYIVNLILAYPDIRILLMQSTAKNTRGLLREIKSHFNGENPNSKLGEVFPKWVKKDKRTGDLVRIGTADGFICPARERTLKEWTVSVAGSKTSKTGQHYDVMFFDDLVTDQNFRNQELQEKLIEDFSHLTPLLEPGGFKTVTGTRYSFGDLYGWIIRNDAERREWSISVRTCWKDNDQRNGVLFPQKKTSDGRTIGYTEDLLLKIQKDDPATFSCQYLNQPLIASQQLFTQPLLMGAVRPRDTRVEVGPAILFVDLHGGSQSSSNDVDNSTVLCGRQDLAGNMYVCDLKSDRFSILQLAHTILDMAIQYRPLKVLVEGTASSNFFLEYLRVIANDKNILLPADKMFFLVGIPKWDELVQQFIEFPRGRHDDEIDTVGLMVQFYASNSQGFRSFEAPGLPWFLRQPGTDYFLEKELITGPERAVETCGSEFTD
jgi:hypothetical protein